jgi:hypothetical protein
VPEVLEPHRPTLPELLTPRLGRAGLRAVLAVGVLLVLALIARAAFAEEGGSTIVSQARPVPFNLRYTEGLARAAPQGDEQFRLEARRGDLFVQSFAVSPLELAPYRGDVTAPLAVLGSREIDRLRGRYAQFELVQDGKARVNDQSGYAILFRARLGARRLYGRQILLPEQVPGARRGVRLTLLATPAGGVSSASDVGVRGVIKRPYRTFRFGLRKP